MLVRKKEKKETVQDQEKKKEARTVHRSVANALQTLTPRTLTSTAQFNALG